MGKKEEEKSEKKEEYVKKKTMTIKEVRCRLACSAARKMRMKPYCSIRPDLDGEDCAHDVLLAMHAVTGNWDTGIGESFLKWLHNRKRKIISDSVKLPEYRMLVRESSFFKEWVNFIEGFPGKNNHVKNLTEQEKDEVVQKLVSDFVDSFDKNGIHYQIIELMFYHDLDLREYFDKLNVKDSEVILLELKEKGILDERLEPTWKFNRLSRPCKLPINKSYEIKRKVHRAIRQMDHLSLEGIAILLDLEIIQVRKVLRQLRRLFYRFFGYWDQFMQANNLLSEDDMACIIEDVGQIIRKEKRIKKVV